MYLLPSMAILKLSSGAPCFRFLGCSRYHVCSSDYLIFNLHTLNLTLLPVDHTQMYPNKTTCTTELHQSP